VAKICKVLIVEDNDDVRLLMEEVFDAEGYLIRTARNGSEMHALIAAEPDFDMLVIDVSLPGSDNGLDLADAMAARGYSVILVSGDHLQVERMDQSGYPYLLKPFSVRSLIELIDQLLQAAAVECERAARRA